MMINKSIFELRSKWITERFIYHRKSVQHRCQIMGHSVGNVLHKSGYRKSSLMEMPHPVAEHKSFKRW